MAPERTPVRVKLGGILSVRIPISKKKWDMRRLACPICRQPVSDEALDSGACPVCGHDGPMIASVDPKRAWLVATLAVVACGALAGAYLLIPWNAPVRVRPLETASVQPAPPPSAEPVSARPEIAPHPHFPRPKSTPSLPAAAAPARKNPWNPRLAPAGQIEHIDAREVREKRIDAPDGTVAVSDMNREDRLTLTGTVRQLRIGSIGGSAVLDASGLTAREIVITGDLGGRATVSLHAPGGMVRIGGHVEGRSRLVVIAPRGHVYVQEGSGKLDGDAELKVEARDVEIAGPMSGNAKLVVTLTGGGNLISGPVRENASVVTIPPQ
jgi:hypothetical protein